jgi:hypothetical protein
MKQKLLFLICLFTLFSFSDLYAKYSRTASVKYKQEYGWSKTYTVEVNFLTGYELNQATSTYNYDTYSVYAIIFWDQDQATVIKLKNYLICGMEVTEDCIENSIYDLEGLDQDGDKWNICISTYCY